MNKNRSLTQWLEWIGKTHTSEIELGLLRATEVAVRMELQPIDGNGLAPASMLSGSVIANRIVTVAGTNGKGTTIAVLEQLLIDAGKSVGVYTSPHIHQYNERFRINQQTASDASVTAALQAVDTARENTPLTYFEFSTLAALYLFSRQALDVVILEVGLGGRLDAVNIVPADIAVITRIDLDHQDWLGDSRELIAAEKAGILRAGIDLICSDRNPTDSIRSAAQEHDVRAAYLGSDFDIEANNGSQDALVWFTGDGEQLVLEESHLHPDSIAAALVAADLLRPPLAPRRDAAAISESISRVQLAGRLQVFEFDGVPVLIDVAHNPAAVSYLSSVLNERLDCRPCYAVFAAMADKDWQSMVDIIKDVIDHWFLAELPGNQRAESAANVAEYLKSELTAPTAPSVKGSKPNSLTSPTVVVYADPEQALSAAIAAAQTQGAAQTQSTETSTSTPQVLVFGSFFTVAPALTLCEAQTSEHLHFSKHYRSDG